MMRKQSNSTKSRLENLLMETWAQTRKGKEALTEEDKITTLAINNFLAYFKMEDYLYNTMHIDIIQKVYLSVKYRTFSNGKVSNRIFTNTKEGYAQMLHIDVRTLRRYTSLYLKCFEKFLADIHDIEQK